MTIENTDDFYLNDREVDHDEEDEQELESGTDSNVSSSLEHIEKVIAGLGYLEVGRWPFRRYHSDLCEDVDCFNIAWAKQDSGLLITADTWIWKGDALKVNGLWIHGAMPTEASAAVVRYRSDFGNSNWGEEHLLFHKDVRDGVVRWVNAFESGAAKQWPAHSRNTDWIFVNHSHEFEAYNVSVGLHKRTQQVVAGPSVDNARHFSNQCLYTEKVSMEHELTLPDWVQVMLNTKAYHEHYTATTLKHRTAV